MAGEVGVLVRGLARGRQLPELARFGSRPPLFTLQTGALRQLIRNVQTRPTPGLVGGRRSRPITPGAVVGAAMVSAPGPTSAEGTIVQEGATSTAVSPAPPPSPVPSGFTLPNVSLPSLP